jgi:hypothetical protein
MDELSKCSLCWTKAEQEDAVILLVQVLGRGNRFRRWCGGVWSTPGTWDLHKTDSVDDAFEYLTGKLESCIFADGSGAVNDDGEVSCQRTMGGSHVGKSGPPALV